MSIFTKGLDLLPFGVFDAIAPFNVAHSAYAATIDRSLTFIQWSQAYVVNTTNNGANYWKIELYRKNAGLIVSMNTSGGTAGIVGTLTTNTFVIPSVDPSFNFINIFVTPVGAPGPLYLYGPALKVL